VKLVVAGVTDVGRLRDGNEDSFVVDERLPLFAVADGMGGHRGGEVASATAIEALRAAFAGGRAINDAVKAANVAVIEKASNDPDLAGMGTTMTATTPVGGSALLIAHVGDSRAYRLRDGAIERLTEDHSLVEELVREGRLTEEQAESHPQRAIITRALGVDEDVAVDLYTVDVNAGDRILLCSDGLTTMLRDREIEGIARQEPDPRLAANRLVEAANEAGGEDNITVVVLDVTEVDDAAPPDPDALTEHTAPFTPTPAVAPDAEPAEPVAPAPTTADAPPSRRHRVRNIAFVAVPLLFIIAVAVGAIAYYDHNNWYFGTAGGEVVLYRGRPNHLIWSSSVDSKTGIAVGALSELGHEAINHQTSFDSRPSALAFIQSATTTSTVPPTTKPAKRPAPKKTTSTTHAKAAATTTTLVAGG
jgi:protein phosphatase